MDKALDVELAHAWDRLRPFARRPGPAASADELSSDWADGVRFLAELFAGHLGPDEVASRFVIPADYARFMTRVGGGWAWGSEYTPQSLWTADTVVAETADEFRKHVVERPTDARFVKNFPEPPDDGLWLGIGWFSDKHATLLCCDRRHADFGCVIDDHDGHPWLNGAGPNHVTGRTFVDWLIGQAEAEAGTAPDESH